MQQGTSMNRMNLSVRLLICCARWTSLSGWPTISGSLPTSPSDQVDLANALRGFGISRECLGDLWATRGIWGESSDSMLTHAGFRRR